MAFILFFTNSYGNPINEDGSLYSNKTTSSYQKEYSTFKEAEEVARNFLNQHPLMEGVIINKDNPKEQTVVYAPEELILSAQEKDLKNTKNLHFISRLLEFLLFCLFILSVIFFMVRLIN